MNNNGIDVCRNAGIRSVSFRGDILTIGTGAGAILFYDLRATKYMHLNDTAGEIMFKTNTGWVVITIVFSRIIYYSYNYYFVTY